MNNNLFRKSSIDRVNSPEQLNDYIRVSNPSIWIILMAVILLLSAVIVWGVFGSLPTTVTTSGMAKDGKVVIFLPEGDAAKLSPGMKADISNLEGTVTEVSTVPKSYEEISSEFTDAYTLYSLKLTEWNYAVTITAAGIPEGVVPVSVVTKSDKPISFVLN